MPTSSIPSGGGGGLAPKYQKFTSSGTFTLPDGYGAAKPLLITIQIIGGGGGGAGTWATANNGNTLGSMNRSGYFGQGARNVTGTSISRTVNDSDGKGGGSGGIAATQMYLTSNLTITVGAAGTRSFGTIYTYSTGSTTFSNTSTSAFQIASGTVTGGTGGTTTAGSVSSAGGVGGVQNYAINSNYDSGNPIPTERSGNVTGGLGGTPSGTQGDATPLLGTLAGGSGTSTPIFGSFGIGGIKTDLGTATGVEGTGGGYGSIGAPGAVIITWWQ